MRDLCLEEAPAKELVVTLSPTVLIRSAGLPVQAAQFLDAPAVMATASNLLAIDTLLAQKADALSSVLHAAIGRMQGDTAMQRMLLALRRGIFNRRPVDPKVLGACLKELPPEIRLEVESWERLRQEREHCVQEGEALLLEHLGETRRSLRILAEEPILRRALALSNPSLHRPLGQYVSSTSDKLDRKLRRAERTLLTYLLRAVYKTSPLSTLTSVAMAHLSPDANPDAATLDREVRCFTRPHIGILARAEQALTRNAHQYPSLQLRLQAGLVIDGKKVRYWRRTEKLLDKAYGPIQGEVSEFFFRVQLTPALRALMALLQERSHSVREIIACLEGTGLSQTDAQEYLRLLLGSGLLVVSGLRQSIHNPEFWEDTIALLEKSGDARLQAELAPSIGNLLERSNHFATASTSERLTILAQLDASYEDLLRYLGSNDRPPKPTLYEDSSFASQKLRLQRHDWDCFVEPLAEVQRLSALFDPLLIPKVTFRALFKRRFGAGGRCSDVQEMSDYFHEIFYFPFNRTDNGRNNFRERLGSGSLNLLRVPEVQQILDAQHAYTEQLWALLARKSDAHEVIIPQDWIETFGGVAAKQYNTLANSFFVQRVDSTEDDPLLVLNHIYTGFGCMLSRYCYMFDKAGENSLHAALHEVASSRDTQELIYAEIQGGYQTNLNQHPVITQFELLCPGESGTLPVSRQIHLAELRLEHDSLRDDVYLYCERLGRRVVPLYLGMMHPLALPSLQKTLTLFSPPPIMGPGHDDDKDEALGSEMRYAPRLRSRNIVLRRGSWTCSLSSLPARSPETTDFQHLLAVQAWKQQHALPERGFITIFAAQDKASDEEPTGAGLDTSKPLFFDFKAPSCIFLLDKMIAGKSGRLRFTEALPLPEGASFSADRKQYVSEFILEIHQELLPCQP
jgi:hypothetical protein